MTFDIARLQRLERAFAHMRLDLDAPVTMRRSRTSSTVGVIVVRSVARTPIRFPIRSASSTMAASTLRTGRSILAAMPVDRLPHRRAGHHDRVDADRESSVTCPASRASISRGEFALGDRVLEQRLVDDVLDRDVRQQLLGERAEHIAQIADGVNQPERAFARTERGRIGERLVMRNCGDAADLGVAQHAMLAILPAEAGFLVAGVMRLHLLAVRAVDVKLAEVEILRGPHRRLVVGGEDIGRQAVPAVVGDAEGLVIRRNRSDRHDRPEHLFAHDIHRWLHVSDYRGLHPISAGEFRAARPAAADDYARPLAFARSTAAMDLSY